MPAEGSGQGCRAPAGGWGGLLESGAEAAGWPCLEEPRRVMECHVSNSFLEQLCRGGALTAEAGQEKLCSTSVPVEMHSVTEPDGAGNFRTVRKRGLWGPDGSGCPEKFLGSANQEDEAKLPVSSSEGMPGTSTGGPAGRRHQAWRDGLAPWRWR